MNKKEKFISSVIHIVTFDKRKYEQIETLYDNLINSIEDECAKRFNDFLESDDFKNGIMKILSKY